MYVSHKALLCSEPKENSVKSERDSTTCSLVHPSSKILGDLPVQASM